LSIREAIVVDSKTNAADQRAHELALKSAVLYERDTDVDTAVDPLTAVRATVVLCVFV